MKKAMVAAMFAMFALGVLFPVSSTSTGKSHFFQAIKDVFHYYPGDAKGIVKETPAKFEDTMKKQLKYPEAQPETK